MTWPYPRSAFERRRVAEELSELDPERMVRVATGLLQVLARGPVPSLRKLRGAVRAQLGQCSDGDVDAAVELLGACLERTEGPRGATRYRLLPNRLPPQLRRYFPA